MQKLSSNILLALVCWLCSSSLTGQTLEADMQLLQGTVQSLNQTEVHEHQHAPSFLLADHPSFLVRWNPVTLTLGSLMFIYQTVISPQLSNTCIHTPSCSAYSKSLFREYGMLRGLIFTADRISRCNRLALYDVPPWEIDLTLNKIREDLNYYQIKTNK